MRGHSEISDQEIMTSILEVMEIKAIKYMPTIGQFKSVEVLSRSKIENGNKLYYLINKRGGMSVWQEELNLESKKEYESRVKGSKNSPFKYLILLQASFESGVKCDLPCAECDYRDVCSEVRSKVVGK